MSEQALVLAQAARVGSRAGAVSSGGLEGSGTRGREEQSLGGLDYLLATQRRAETMVQRGQARLESLREEEKQAMKEEARALEEEEAARDALEARVPNNGEGEELQEAFYLATDAVARVSGELAARTAQRRAAEEALERAREELRRAGEDTRTMADKRKRNEQSAEGRRKGREVQGKA